MKIISFLSALFQLTLKNLVANFTNQIYVNILWKAILPNKTEIKSFSKLFTNDNLKYYFLSYRRVRNEY